MNEIQATVSRLRSFATPRLELRGMAPADEALYCGLYMDEGTMRHIAPPLSAKRAGRAFHELLDESRHASGDPQLLVILRKDTREAVGIAAIQSIDLARRRAEAGMMLKPGARALGYSSEVLAGLVTAAMAALPIDTVWVQYHPANTAADRLVRGLGFARRDDTGITEANGENLVFSIDRRSWFERSFSNQQGK